MTAPSKNFTVISDGDIDPDSPVTTNLMTALRDNDIHLEEWLGDGYTAAKDHNHNGTNSKKVNYADLSGAPSPSAMLSFVNSQDVTVTWSGGVDGEFDTGALGLTPVGAEITIKSGSSSTNFFNWPSSNSVSALVSSHKAQFPFGSKKFGKIIGLIQ